MKDGRRKWVEMWGAEEDNGEERMGDGHGKSRRIGRQGQ